MTIDEFIEHCKMLGTSGCTDMLETIARLPFIEKSSRHTEIVDTFLDHAFALENMQGAVTGTIKKRNRTVLNVEEINKQLEIEN